MLFIPFIFYIPYFNQQTALIKIQ